MDVKKLKGEWKGYYRIRSGEVRIILKVDQTEKVLYIDVVDFRKDAY
ncbi:MAG TPA: hypothetical protein PLQ41_05635 [bacterium]|nr:hypothetical protein [bacterium]HPP30020.1 hypothetical protein [bacterium]